ncbi:MAG: hypothetical protein JWQ95_4344 [Sphaerisporangium sp.]|nr:hypothetical protein [Sphaerisporangium sp.]
MVAKVAVGETVGQQPEDAKSGEQSLGSGSVKRRPGMRWPVGVRTGSVMAAKAAWPSVASAACH